MQATRLQGFSLSVQQHRLWSLRRNGQIPRTLCAMQIQGVLERERFKKSIKQVIEQNEILRTFFYALPGMDIPMQVISEQALWSYTEISLEPLEAAEQSRKLDEVFALLQEETYDLQQKPLVLVRLFSLSARQHIVLISLPAFCADSYSLKPFMQELLNTYSNRPPAEEILQYADIAAWQEEQLVEEEALPQKEYWRKITLSQIINTQLPFQYGAQSTERLTDNTFTPQTVEIALSPSLAYKVQAQAKSSSVSLSTWLLACWQVLLWHLSTETTFVIGVACDGRNYEDLREAIGPYTRLVPIEARFEKDRPFAQTLAAVHASLQEATKRQLYFTWDVLDTQNTQNEFHDSVKADAAQHFFPLSFEYDIYPAAFKGEELTLSLLKRWNCLEPFALKLSALQIGEHLQLDLHYDLQCITRAQARALARLFLNVLEQVTERPHIQSGKLALLSAEEREQQVAALSGPRRSWDVQGLHRLFEAWVKRRPTTLAAISRHEQMTYQELNTQANQLARILRQRGVGPNVVVGLCLSRQVSMLVGLLGILKAGGAYLPLDANSPPARLQHQLQESGALLLLTQEEQRSHLPDWTGDTLYLEALAEELAAASPENQEAGSSGEDLAYVIYTSGSTGVPKGVMVTQRNVVNYTLGLCERLRAEEGWHYATVSTLAADLGNTAIFGALASGGCVQILDYEQVTSADAMAAWASQHPIDVLKIVPSHLSALLEDERGRAFLPRRALISGGEAPPASLLKRIGELGATCVVYNHYGPTETTIGVLINELSVSARGGHAQIALGQPIANTQVYVLDAHRQMVPQGVRGELYIGGAGVARGYVGQGGLTAERFVPDPYNEGTRLYRTGDLVYYGANGQLEFLGRADGQVKLRGYRIELGEIEAALRQHPQVRESIVVLRNEKGPQLVGYVVARQRERIAPEQLEAYMHERLPAYMLPAEYVQLETWPLTANGKVDRQRLPQPEQRGDHENRAVGEARSPLEELIVQVWRELLGDAKIGIHDNFFAFGGHSLLATRVIARIRAILQVELPVRAVFEAATVAELAHRVEQVRHEGEGVQIPPLVVCTRPDALPLSYAQQRLWFLDQLEPGSTAYLASRVFKVGGALDAQSLERSLQALIGRHESLRTTFPMQAGQPVQAIQPGGHISLPVIDLQALRQEQSEQEAQRLLSQESGRSCDLVHGPLLRTYLVRLGPQEHLVLLTLHHIITDGWSNEVLVRELAILYQAFTLGLSSPLAPLPIQYADYALWQRSWLRDEILEAQLSYWRMQLSDMSPLDLPTDYPRLPAQMYRGAVLSRELPEALSQSLVALSLREDVTLFMLLLAALQVLLLRYTGKTDISVGTAIANRARAELENVVGFFVNMLVMRSDLSGHPTFLQVLQQIRRICLDAYTHQDVPFEKLVDALQAERRSASHSPLFQVSFQLAQHLTSTTDPAHLIPGLTLEVLESGGASTNHELRIMMIRDQRGLSCTAFYDANLFAEPTIHRFLEHFQILLEGIVSSPEQPVALLPLLSEQEWQRQLVDWNATQVATSEEVCIHQLFERQARRTPDALALVFEEQALTYAELNRRANQLAHHLQELEVGPEVPVGICMQRSLELVIALLAILKAGGAYVPLDPTSPAARLHTLIEDQQLALVLTQRQLQPQLNIPELRTLALDVFGVPGILDIPDGNENLDVAVAPGNLLYIISTSGSTGKPRGVMVSHRNFANLLAAFQQEFAFDAQDRVLVVTSFTFDLTQKNVFAPLLVGGCIQLFPDGYDPARIVHLIAERAMTVLNCTPGMFYPIVEESGRQQFTALASLRRVFLGGEAIAPARLSAWMGSTHFRAIIVNTYGPTECSDVVAFHRLAPSWLEALSSVPIGRPLANTQLYLLDSQGNPIPVGVAGELYIGGIGVARGYIQRPEWTAERFLPHPWSQEPGVRLYRTGDLARYLPDGSIEYLGRRDQQVKIRGHRIELAEIEVALEAHPAVQDAVAVLREDRLVAYVVPDQAQVEAINHAGQTPLVTERVKRWRDLYDEIYQRGTVQAVQTFNTVGWNSSYTGQSIAREEMQTWLEDTLALVRTYQPQHIWEIGCGTGLLLFPLASACVHYYGTDFSASVLESVRRQLAYIAEQQGVQLPVTLLQRQADDFSALPEQQIDTVLINSVVQYFPNVDYLLRVLDGAVRLVAPGGRIIVGDVRSLPLLEAFHADVQMSRASETLTRQQLWHQVQQQAQEENELVLDPAFFERWAQTTGRVHHVEMRLKRGRYQNELTRFRYQVVLHVGEPLPAEKASRPQLAEELNWAEQALTWELVCQKLREDRPDRLRIHQVPNARIERAIHILQWLKDESGPETVGQWRAQWRTHTFRGVEPEDLRADAEQFGYHTTISWGRHEGDGRYSVLFQRIDGDLLADAEEELLPQARQGEPVKLIVDWQRYANQPLWKEAERLLVPQLRSYLSERLPDYMLPSNLVVLKALPLTRNGKIDRRALPLPGTIQNHDNGSFVAPQTPLEKQLALMWQEMLYLDQVSVQASFFDLGGDSIKAAIFINNLQERLGVILYVITLFDHPTIASLAEYLVARHATEIERVFGSDAHHRSGETREAMRAPGRQVDAQELAVIRSQVRPLSPLRSDQQPETKNPPAIFVLAPPRSGTTLLRVMLAGHPHLFAPPELELLSFTTLRERHETYTGRMGFWLEGTIRALMEIKGWDSETARAFIAACEQQDMTVQDFYLMMQQGLNGRILVDKTPSYALDSAVLERAEAYFEQPYYIHLLRHPYGMIRSFEEAELDQVFFRTPRSQMYETRELAELVWLLSQQNITTFLDTIPAQRQMRIYFEDLVGQPEQVMRALCHFLRIDFHPDMLHPYQDKGQRMTDGISVASKMLGDIKFHQHNAIDAQVAEQWKQAYTRDFLGEITWQTAEALGYPRPTEEAQEERHTVAIESLPRGQQFPLSFSQQRLWILDRLHPNSTTYLGSGVLRFQGILNSSALEQSIQEIVQRHEILRTTFALQRDTEQPVQIIHPTGQFVLPLIDLSNLRQRVEVAQTLAHQEAQIPCDLTVGPLFRTYLLRLAPQEHLLLLAQHHIITDGWSNDVIVRELTELYRSYIAGEPASLAPLPIQYADYAYWQRHYLQGEQLQQHIAYWQQQLQGATPLELPADAPRAAIRADDGARYAFTLATNLSLELLALSRREGVTLFMTLLAAFQVLLYRLSGQVDIVVGTDVANRSRAETEQLIGFFVNLLALRTNMQGTPSFRKILQQVRAMVLRAYAHQELPFELVVEHVQVERKEHQTPLVQVLLVMQNTPRSAIDLPDLQLEVLYREDAAARFDLALFLQEEAQGIRGSVVYRAGLFKEETIATWMRQFAVLLRSITAQPDTLIDMLEIYSEEEKAKRAKAKLAKKHLEAKRIRATKNKGHAIELSESGHLDGPR